MSRCCETTQDVLDKECVQCLQYCDLNEQITSYDSLLSFIIKKGKTKLLEYAFVHFSITKSTKISIYETVFEKALENVNSFGIVLKHTEVLDDYSIKLSIKSDIGILDLLLPLLEKMNWRFNDDCAHMLIYATNNGNTRLVKFILAHIKDRNVHDHLNRTPLMRAAELGKVGCCRILLSSMPDDINKVDNYGCDAIYYAVYHRHETIVKCLISATSSGENELYYNRVYSDNMSLLHLTIDYPPIFRLLMEKDNIYRAINGVTPYEYMLGKHDYLSAQKWFYIEEITEIIVEKTWDIEICII